MLPDGPEIEIGEYGFDTGTSGSGAGFGVGLGRVAMARNNQVTSWADSLDAFTTAVTNEAGKSGMPLPMGYRVIAG